MGQFYLIKPRKKFTEIFHGKESFWIKPFSNKITSALVRSKMRNSAESWRIKSYMQSNLPIIPYQGCSLNNQIWAFELNWGKLYGYTSSSDDSQTAGQLYHSAALHLRHSRGVRHQEMSMNDALNCSRNTKRCRTKKLETETSHQKYAQKL